MVGKLLMSGSLHAPPGAGNTCTYLVYEVEGGGDDYVNVYLMSTMAVGSIVDQAENLHISELGDWLIGRIYY